MCPFPLTRPIKRLQAEFPRGSGMQSLSGPVLRDTARLSQRYAPIARYGVLGVSTWPIRCDTPSLFSERFPLGEHAKWRCDTPPPKGYLSDTCAIPHENKANGCDTPLCDTISKGYCAIWGGISHWAAKCNQTFPGQKRNPSPVGKPPLYLLCKRFQNMVGRALDTSTPPPHALRVSRSYLTSEGYIL